MWSSMNATMLLLADGRFPSGGHAHSAGAEAAIGVGDVHDHATLERFVEGRLATAGLVDAAFAAATAHQCNNIATARFDVLGTEYMARTASARLRQISLSLARQLLRAGARTWPSQLFAACDVATAGRTPQPVAMGVVAAAARCSPHEAALCQLHHLVGAMTSAGVRLLGLDPFEISAIAARLAPVLDDLAVRAALSGAADPATLPAGVALLHDVLAEHHATWEVRLFAS
jgi:urease accessory protein